jgi:hypothetical protein
LSAVILSHTKEWRFKLLACAAMTHIAIQDTKDGKVEGGMEQMTDEQYPT